jgi:putative peptide zinc metalloprotease protein
MTGVDYCAFPPRLGTDVEITDQTEARSPSSIVGSAAVGRYLLLGIPERRVVDLLDGSRTPDDICAEFVRRHGVGLNLETVIRFLTKLDGVGILAGQRGTDREPLLPGAGQRYVRWRLFNPERLFARVMPALRWIWTPGFFAGSLLLMAGAMVLALLKWAEISTYAAQALRHEYVAIVLVAWLITLSHEFAHGLTAKAFGGRATEVGVLLVYYCVPALYCNVSGLHLIPKRSRRLWVIAAGIYWQLLVGASALVMWFLFNPDTRLAGLAMVVVLGSLMDVVFNMNPLIKLDGYYFLSQWLQIPNLMDRSRAWWRARLRRVCLGERDIERSRPSRRDRRVFLVFGCLSFCCALALPIVIVWYATQALMAMFYLPGFVLGVFLATVYAWGPLKQLVVKREATMTTHTFDTHRLRRFVPVSLALCAAAPLCTPWRASVGSYGTLTAIPGREAIIRAADGGSLTILNVTPGQHLAAGAAIGRLANVDLEEQRLQARAERARVDAEIDRLNGELRVERTEAMSAQYQLAQRSREFRDVDDEERQIALRLHSAPPTPLSHVSNTAVDTPQFPPAMAMLEAAAESMRTKLGEVMAQRDRARSLYAEGILSQSDLDAIEAKSSSALLDAIAAREQLKAALVEHERAHAVKATDLNLAGSSLSARREQASTLTVQLEAARRLDASLAERVALLERKQAQFALIAPVPGILFGEELPRLIGHYFSKGDEICRVADTRELLVRVFVAEQALGDVALGQPVRMRTRALPDQTFRGVVSKIGDESELDANGQRAYRVELTVDNSDGRLRPGMTAFARIDFGRHLVGWLLAHKLKQALRPELWLL